MVADRYGPVRCYFDGRLDNIAGPVALARRDITREREIRKGGEGDIVRAANTRLQHAAAPYRDTGRLRDIVHALGIGETAHAPELDIDNSSGVHRDGLFGLMRRANAFIQTDGRLKLGLQL